MSKQVMKRANVRFNYSDYLLLPEDKRYEILDGDLCVVPAPGLKHQAIAMKLKLALYQYITEMGIGRLFDAPCDVILSDEDILQPDIIFVRKERSAILGEMNIRGAPDFVVEILSPGTRNRDLGVKRKIYSEYGVAEYWIVDPEAASVEVLLWSELGYASAGVHKRADQLCSPLMPGLGLIVSDLFQD
jgi:Uma2 family endonuclease